MLQSVSMSVYKLIEGFYNQLSLMDRPDTGKKGTVRQNFNECLCPLTAVKLQSLAVFNLLLACYHCFWIFNYLHSSSL